MGGGGGSDAKAVGGNIDGLTPGNGYTYHVFQSSGGFSVPTTSPLDGTNVEVLVVAGGGAGGAMYPQGGGGGGAGGLRLFPAVPIVAGKTYAAKVGLGGVGRSLANDPTWGMKAWNEGDAFWYPPSIGSTGLAPRQGEPSYFDAPYYNPGGGVIPGASHEATGGGRGGGSVFPPAAPKPPGMFVLTSGGSAGGFPSPPSGVPSSTYARGNIYSYSPVEGYPGWGPTPGGTSYNGGGGGAGEKGWYGGHGSWSQTSPRVPSSIWNNTGYGGNGTYMPGWNPTGSGGSDYYAGGGGAGGGSASAQGLGGYGGGGAGGYYNSPAPAKHGTANSGGGGGGGGAGPGASHPNTAGGDGGSGIVIVRYPA